MPLDRSLMLVFVVRRMRFPPVTSPFCTTLPRFALPCLVLPCHTADSEDEENHGSGGKKQVLGTTLDLCLTGFALIHAVDVGAKM